MSFWHIVAGAATAVNGASDIVESVTDYNPVRDTVFAGDEEQYSQYEMQMALGSQLGAGALYGLTDGGSSVCFEAGTLVSAERGDVAIENIKTGDLVWATDEETGETALKEVVQLFRNETEEWVHITVDGEKITCTPNHPFYVPQKGWTSAIDLRAGDRLQLLNGEYVVVEQVQHELLESPETTYNFEVEDFHTYYVGEDQILVHNKCSKYYKATRTDDGVMQGAEITKKQALNRIRSGKDVIANSRSAAKSLAKNAFGNSKVYSEIHPKVPNAMYHFHDDMNHIFHVFFK